MSKLWQPFREFLPIAAVILLCMIIVPVAQANDNSGATTAATVAQAAPQSTATTAAAADSPKTTKPKAKVAATKPRDKSVLDTEVLDSPISYFKHAFSSEEDDASASSNNGAVVITVKALVATLLSTIM